MKKSLLKITSILMIILILSFSIIPASKSLAASYANVYVGVTNYYSRAFQVLDIVNKERTSRGLEALSMDESLLESAMLRSAENSVLFEHIRPNGTQCFTVNNLASGENIIFAYPELTPAGAMQGWMNSTGHRENILRPEFKSIGIGCANANGIWYYVQLFGYDKAVTPGVKKADQYKVHKFQIIDSLVKNVKHDIPSSMVLGSGLSWDMTGYTITMESSSIEGATTKLDPRSFLWVSSNPDILKVDSRNGTLTGGDKFGKATVTGRIGSKTVIQCTVTVNLPFKDVKESDYYYNAVVTAFKDKLISGTTPTTFSPKKPITRGQLVTILHRMEGYPKASSNAKKFSDVKSGPYYDAIMWASSKGIVSGYNNGNFGPNDEISRAQFATILYNYARFKKVNVKNKANISGYKDYKDVQKKTSYAIDALSWAVGNNVMNGTADGKINPTGKAIRGQAAVMITNYCTYVRK